MGVFSPTCGLFAYAAHGGPYRDNFRTRLAGSNKKFSRPREQLQVIFAKSKKKDEKDDD